MDAEKNPFESPFMDDNRLNLLSDGVLRTEDGHVFHIHKFTLSKSCKYFYALFCGMGMNENDQMIPGIRGEVLSNILSHIYTGNAHLTEDNACEIMMASDYLLMDDLLSTVKMFVKQIISVKNCLCILMTAITIGRDDISSESYRFVQTHFEKVVYNENGTFGDLQIETLKLFLHDRNLCITSEKTVYFAIVKWIEADIVSRLLWMPELLMYMAVSDVDEDLATEILEHPLVLQNPFCQGIMDVKSTFNEGSNLKVLQKYIQGRPQSLIPFCNNRLPSKLNCIARFSAIGGMDSVEIFITYDENIDLWRKIFEIDLNPATLICIDDSIYMILANVNRYIRYNVVERQWHELNHFMISRYRFVAVECEHCIYVLGGISAVTGEEIYDVEVYDPEFDIWYYGEPMLPISSFAAVSLNQHIYVVGYRSVHGAHHMVAQVFEEPTGVWRVLPAVSIDRYGFALVPYLGKLYVIGGFNGERHLKEVEIFYPLQREWKMGTSLPYVYYNPKAFVLQDLLIVCDNHWQDRTYLKTNPPVFWNVHKDCWESFDESSPMKNLHLYHFLTMDNIDSIRDLTKQNRLPDTSFEKVSF